MTVTDAKSAFEEMVKQYESRGWEVRTIDHTAQRATVRTRVEPSDVQNRTAQVTTMTTDCRRLWVDSKGEVQETNVPC